MRVAVDINDLHRPQSGIGRYICGLLSGFADLGTDDELLLLHKDPLTNSPISGPGLRHTIQRHAGPSVTWWMQVTVPRVARRAATDVLFCPAVRAPVRHRLPLVLTVHDVIFAVHPELYTVLPRLYMWWTMSLALPHCQRVVAVSEATRRDLVERFGVPPDRIEVIYHGIEPRFRPRDRDEARSALRRADLSVPERYLLFVGTLEPRKNLLNLLLGFELARAQGLPHQLVIAGKRGWLDEAVMARIERMSEARQVRYLGHVPDAVLPDLYSAATAVVYPSRYEGFGFPVLEGMASGVPVVTTSAPGVAEVAGDACLMVEPHDTTALAQALISVAEDQPLRQRLIASGLARAQQFTWRESARRTRAVLAQASGGA